MVFWILFWIFFLKLVFWIFVLWIYCPKFVKFIIIVIIIIIFGGLLLFSFQNFVSGRFCDDDDYFSLLQPKASLWILFWHLGDRVLSTKSLFWAKKCILRNGNSGQIKSHKSTEFTKSTKCTKSTEFAKYNSTQLNATSLTCHGPPCKIGRANVFHVFLCYLG